MGDVSPYAADLRSVLEAKERIRPYAKITPVLTSTTLDSLAGRRLFFKCENFQRGGAFKFRGACNTISLLAENGQAGDGVVTHSSGNHAAAVALAAKLHNIPAHLVLPRNAPACKVANVERYEGQVWFCESNLQSREQRCREVQARTGAVLVHPFNDGRVMSGQGTVGVELLEQVPDLDAIVVPISGGGLISGISVAAKALKPTIKIFAAEPSAADDAAKSKAADKIVTMDQSHTVADGLRANLGDLTWPVVRDLVEEVITVPDSDILIAMKLCYEVLKIVVEPSSAISLAVVLSDTFQLGDHSKDCRNVGVILSGGNVDLDSFWTSLSNAR